MPNSIIIKGVIDRFEEDWAVIKTEDYKEILWPKVKLIDGLKEGSAVQLIMADEPIDQADREAMAKAMLNEILNPPNNEPDKD
jgi:hypothetical protein